MRFEGKSVIVTGAASGIGLAVARRMAAEGASLVIGNRNMAGLEEAAASIGGSATAVALDIADPVSCAAIVERAVSVVGGLDILCNIAGVLDFAPLADLTAERWDRTISINLGGVMYMSRAAMLHLIERRGSIVNMASAAGLVGIPYNAAYCASKHGVIGLTKALTLEFAAQGVRINAVCPTGVKTPMIADPMPDGVDMALLGHTRSWLDDGELCDPEDIADAVAFLVSMEARRITGVHSRLMEARRLPDAEALAAAHRCLARHIWMM